MSADLLRRAAALMRARATGASNGGKTAWYSTDTGEERFDGYDVWSFVENRHWKVAQSDFAGDAEHIASWHPAVALAVADLLDRAASYWIPDPHGEDEDVVCCCCPHQRDALKLARTYLGEDA